MHNFRADNETNLSCYLQPRWVVASAIFENCSTKLTKSMQWAIVLKFKFGEIALFLNVFYLILFYFNVGIPMGWILTLFISRHILPYIKRYAGILTNQSFSNLQMVPLHLESWTSQRHHPVRGVRAHVLTIQVNHWAIFHSFQHQVVYAVFQCCCIAMLHYKPWELLWITPLDFRPSGCPNKAIFSVHIA